MKLISAEWVKCPFDESVQFKLRGLNGIEYLDFISSGDASSKGRRISISGDQARIVLYGVVDWRGVSDDSGPVTFAQDRWENVPLRYVDWAIGEIIKRSTLDEDAEKN